MKDVVEIIGYGGIIPACIACGLIYVSRRFLPTDVYHRYATAIALAVAFFFGYVLLPDWATLVPARHWQWLPYLAIAAALLGPPGFAIGVWLIERKLLHLLLAIVTAYMLVPDWERLQPLRSTWIFVLTGYLFGLSLFLEPLATRFSTARFLGLLSVAAVSTSLATTIAVSLKYGQVSGIAAAGLIGCWLSAKAFARDLDARAAVPAAVTLVAGSAFVGAIETTPAIFDLLVIPAAPLMLWLFVRKEMQQGQNVSSALVQTAAVLAPIVLVALRMLVVELRTDA